ncbi:MAG: NAD(P)H-hydrate epimerase [Candidatus Omnitrophica bacterium]|nr:NAD(P)H-hydrate epimerase [Candidatus Omnitrophota bacterium]MCX5699695.1 NAD(P)H-hydrate epimerase [Candidatus Omnitrophota bacterium]
MKKSERVLTAAQAKALDKRAQKEFGISTLILMENAGRAVMEEALKILKSSQGKVAVFCGMGNNGGDGFCAARHLLTAGFKPDVYLTGKVSDVENEAKINLSILLRLKQKITEIKPRNLSLLKKRIERSSLIIDALLGVGARGQIRPGYQKIIDIINSSDIYVLSVDIPSGLDATTGKVLGRCIKADKTITFVCKKRGMVYGEGEKHCGKVLVRTIGIPL